VECAPALPGPGERLRGLAAEHRRSRLTLRNYATDLGDFDGWLRAAAAG